MSFDVFFSDPNIQLPLLRDKEDFLKYIELLFAKYKQILPQLNFNDPDSRTKGIDLCNAIQKSIKESLKGFPNKSYDALDPMLRNVKGILSEAWGIKTGDMDTVRLYRMRVGCRQALTQKDAFHVPYEMRHIISTQRYSIPGLPCLYLGGSLYTCWLEMGCPKFEDIHVAAFRIAEGQNIKFLNLPYNPKWFHDQPGNNSFEENFITIWPLIAACSIKSLHPEAPFKPEYIIPQILLQWIRSNKDFDGIRYFSTYTPKITDDPHWCSNFVFPVKESNAKGFCSRLKNKFISTEPYHWRMLDASNAEFVGHHNDLFDIELFQGVKEEYCETKFGKIQSRLNSLMNLVQIKHQSDHNFGKIN